MLGSKSSIQNQKSRIPTFIPLADAAQKYGLSEKALTQQIQAGKIEAVQLPTGELLVPADSNGSTPKTKEQIIAEEFAHLRGQPISASEASRKYSKIFAVPISQVNFSHWTAAGYIEVKERGYRLLLDEADAAYCARIYAEKYQDYDGQMSGVHVFDETGNSYQLKYEDLAERKRIKRRTLKQRVTG